MKMKCNKHGVQDIVFYSLNGKIHRKCSICQIEYRIKKYKEIQNGKYNEKTKYNGNGKFKPFSDNIAG